MDEANSVAPEHRKMLAVDSGISPDLITARGYRTVTVRAELRRLGFSDSQARVPALLIPIWGVNGEVANYQLRPDEPRVRDGKSVKYETPMGSAMAVDVHPIARPMLGDPAVPLFITEGVKKGDALASNECCAIALLGVWNWRGTNGAGGKTALAAWESVALNGRQTYVVFDSDVMLKPAVHAALARLRGFLESRGAVVALIYLPAGLGAEKVGVDDYLAAGHSLDELLRLASPDLRTLNAEADRQDTQAMTVPDILISGRFMREVTEDALGALNAANFPEPFLFRRGSVPVRLVSTDDLAVAEPLTVPSLKGILDRAANFVRADHRGGVSPARPPTDVLRDILALPNQPFPPLRGIHTAPTFLPGGDLLMANGYHEASGILLRLRNLSVLRRDMPVEEARSLLLDDVLVDFPFADDSSRAHAVAMVLQPMVLRLIGGLLPLYLIDAPARGTGKGLLAEIVAQVALGGPPPVMALPRDEDEIEKRITSLLMSGTSIILLDNINVLSSRSLAAALTAEEWQGRLLGRSQMVQVPNVATWIATGNNVELSDELGRRTIPIRLDAGVQRPEDRSGFKHANLAQWVADHRHGMLTACLSIIQAWVYAGMPLGDRTLGRYERWAGVMGGILQVAGVPGFLDDRIRVNAAADRETQEWIAFCVAWDERYGGIPVTAKDLLELARERSLLLDIWGGRVPLGAQQRFGRALVRRRDRVFGDYRLRSAGRDSDTGNAAYLLERMDRDQNTRNTGNTSERVQRSDSAAAVSGVSGVFNQPQSEDVDPDHQQVPWAEAVQ